jgi:autotransporter strand-loop-strand O-heptosyltransferase
MSHISTGGMPQFVLKRIQTLLDYAESFEIFVVEYEDYGKLFPVQRDQIISLLGNNFYSLDSDKMRVMDIIKDNGIDIVHLDEMPESMGDDALFNELYSNDRTWRIVETCHNSNFRPIDSKRYHPDMYAFCTSWHEDIFAGMDGKFVTIPYPIDTIYDSPSVWVKFASKTKLGFENDKTHVINVGLWTPGKNQAEGLEIARKYPDMMFHFIGNQAGNFMDYWEPLMKDLPSNVKVWGERTDISTFMSAADIFMFNSTWELNPLVLREAIGYKLPIIARNLPQYAGMYDDYINPIDTDLNTLKCEYKVPTDNTSLTFALRHEEAYKKLLELPIKEQKPIIIQHFVDNPYLEIKGINITNKKDKDSVSIVLAHPNNDFRKQLLKNCLSSLNTNIILSANFPIEEDAQELCDYVIYTKDNPLLFKSEFAKYNVAYYHWFTNEKGEKEYQLFEKEHGYCVYTLMRNGVEFAKKLGYKKVNIINYDYQLTKATINNNLKELDTSDFVVYKYSNLSYEEDSYCSAFFSAKTDAILSFVTKFKDKKDYYTNGTSFNILEVKFYNFLKENNYKVKELLMADLKKDNKVDIEGIDYTNDAQRDKVIVDKRFYIEFYENGNCVYNNHIDINNWVKLNRQWFTEWEVKIWDQGNLIYENKLNLKGKRVFISLESKSLGDTLAWMPYALEFKKKHNCHVIVSTFWNHMFDYPELEFVSPGEVVQNIYALYRVGWFYDQNKEPEVPHTISMQKAATNILGLEYKEVRPRLKTKPVEKVKQVVIAIHSTAQAKYWNNPTGWQEVVDYLINKGYVVKLISKEGIDYMGNIAPNGVDIHPNGSIESVMEEMLKSEFFIGIGSGLSWLSWSLNVPTVIISGFSESFAEMEDCIRVSAPEGKCSGCFNRHRLNAGDWNWCPDHKGTERQFECTKSITAQMVIDKIKDFMGKTHQT